MELAGTLGTPLGLAQRKRRLDSLEAAQGAPIGFLDAQTVKPTQVTWLARRMLGLVQECKL